MNLRKKKELARKILKVGKDRISFVEPRMDEIKEAITKQDILGLHKDGAIVVREIKGRKKNSKRPRARGTGKIKKKVDKRKKEYASLAKKLRKYISEMQKKGALNKTEVENLRKRIKNKEFRSKAHLKEQIGERK